MPGTITRVVSARPRATLLAWAGDGTILIGTENGLFAAPAGGGPATPLGDTTAVDGASDLALLPDGKTVLVRSGQHAPKATIVAISLRTKQVTGIGLAGARAPLGVIDNRLVYLDEKGDVTAIGFDAKTLHVRGEPVLLESNVDGVGLSRSGTLAYLPSASMSRMVLTGGGTEVALRSEPANYETPRFSPDGRRIAVSIQADDGWDIWVLDRASNTFTRQTTAGINRAPEWSPDGKRILYKAITGGTISTKGFSTGRTPILWAPADGSQQAETLYVADAAVNEAVLSPDQRWLAYQSDVSGRNEVFVRPFPGEGARVQVSDNGGGEPMWDRKGRMLYYRASEGITVATVTSGAVLSVGARKLVLRDTDPSDPSHQSYDVAPDGAHFLMLRHEGNERRAIVVHNWRRELREKLRKTGE